MEEKKFQNYTDFLCFWFVVLPVTVIIFLFEKIFVTYDFISEEVVLYKGKKLKQKMPDTLVSSQEQNQRAQQVPDFSVAYRHEPVQPYYHNGQSPTQLGQGA